MKKKHYIVIFFSPIFSFLSSPPFNFPVFLFFFFSFFFWILQSKEILKFNKKIFISIGLICGFYIGIFNWLIFPLFSNKIYYLLIPFALFLPPLLMALYFLPSAALFLFLQKKIDKLKYDKNILLISKALLFSFCWSLFELFRSKFIFNGFPWYNISVSLSFSDTFLNLFYYFNHNLLNFIIVLFYISPVLLIKIDKNRLKLCILFFYTSLLIVFIFISKNRVSNFYKNTRLHDKFIKKIAIIPDYTDKIEYFDPKINFIDKKINHINKSLIKLLDLKNDLKYIVFPENSLPFHRYDNKKDINFLMQSIYKNIDFNRIKDIGLFFGTEILKDGNIFNVVYFVKNRSILQIYYKKKLVPFGEYNPFPKFLKFLSFIDIGGFNEIQKNNNSLDLIKDGRFLFQPKICYESVFFDNSLKNINAEYKIIINIVNDTWFEKSIGVHQHFLLSRIDAIINDSFLIRSSNHGFSGFINPVGNVVESNYNTKYKELIYI